VHESAKHGPCFLVKAVAELDRAWACTQCQRDAAKPVEKDSSCAGLLVADTLYVAPLACLYS
jgi:hypothetical protein